MSSFEQASILVLLGVTFLACRDLLTRVIPSGLSAFIVTTYAFSANNIAIIMLIPFYATLISPTPQQWLWFFANNVGRSVVCRYRGCDTRQGVTVNAPWRNSCLVFSLLIAVVFLGEIPDWQTLIGATIVILSNLYSFWCERINSRNS